MAMNVPTVTDAHVDVLSKVFRVLHDSGFSPDEQFALVGAIVTSFARMTTTPETIMVAFIETLQMRLDQMRGES